jgi:hypothetical protein
MGQQLAATLVSTADKYRRKAVTFSFKVPEYISDIPFYRKLPAGRRRR